MVGLRRSLEYNQRLPRVFGIDRRVGISVPVPLEPWFIAIVIFITGGITFLTLEALLHRLFNIFFPTRDEDTTTQDPETIHSDPAIVACLPKNSSEGWMNELPEEYIEETYHVSLTDTVHVKIDGRFLIVSHTKPRASRIAMWNEKPIHNAVIQKQRLYDLQDCVIQLLPKSLQPKKTWSKKYPICLDVKLLPLHVYSKNATDTGEEATLNLDAHFPREVGIFEEEEDRRSSATEEDNEAGEGEGEEQGGKEEPRMTEEEFEATVKEKLATSSLELIRLMDLDDAEESQQYRREDTADNQQKARLYLFARTGRQKEVWFRRFVRARRYPEIDSEPIIEEYLSSMKELMSLLPKGPEVGIRQATLYSGINAIIHRICCDFHRHPKIMERINRIVQKRLDAIKLPSVITRLELSEFDLGTRVPFITHVFPPHLNEHGLWIDMKITFKGKVVAKVKTGVNLTRDVKLLEQHRQEVEHDPSQSSQPPEHSEPTQIPATESVPQDSKSIPEKDHETHSSTVHFYGTGMKPKMLRFIERFTRSKMFQKFSDSRVMQRAVAQLANTEITLIIELQSFDGILTLNIPPPDTDRLWFGFRGVPKMRIKVQPWLGESRLTNILVRRIMEASLRKAVQRMLVLPNMLETVLPFLVSPNYDIILHCGIPCQDQKSEQSTAEQPDDTDSGNRSPGNADVWTSPS